MHMIDHQTAHLSSFIHRFEPATQPGKPLLLLLPGTGGNETDLLPLGRAVSPGSALLSVRGQVLEDGMPRFFRRLTERVFDEEDLCQRAKDLAAFVHAAQAAYNIPAPVVVGFSNGANMAAALLLLHPGLLRAAALLRAMKPLHEAPVARLEGMSVLLLSGISDPIVPASHSDGLATVLAICGADVTHRSMPGGHGLSHEDLKQVRRWLETVPQG